MPHLTRDQIVAQTTLKVVEVDVPEWGGAVQVRELSGRERDAFEASIVDSRSGGKPMLRLENMRARFVAACVIDDAGQPLFYPSDVERLGELSAVALNRVWNVGRRLSGLSDDDVAELEKN